MKSSEVVSVFKHVRSLWLHVLSRCLNVLFNGRIAPHILPRLDETQGGFRWGADALVNSLVDTLRFRKAFDTAWVEATLVRLAQVGVTGGMWRTITNFLVGTLSHVRVGDAHSHSWSDAGIACYSINLLVNSVAADIRRCCPGVRLHSSSRLR